MRVIHPHQVQHTAEPSSSEVYFVLHPCSNFASISANHTVRIGDAGQYPADLSDASMLDTISGSSSIRFVGRCFFLSVGKV